MFLPQIAELLADERRQELRRISARRNTTRHPSSSFLEVRRRRLSRGG